jgi:hypothetical protein
MDKNKIIFDTIAYLRKGPPNDTVERIFYERLITVPDEQIKAVCERLLGGKWRPPLMLCDIDEAIGAERQAERERRELEIDAARNRLRPNACALCGADIRDRRECPSCGAHWRFDEGRLEYLFEPRSFEDDECWRRLAATYKALERRRNNIK